jgi:hypothetical protein
MGLIIPVTVAAAVASPIKTARYRRVLMHNTKPFMNPNVCQIEVSILLPYNSLGYSHNTLALLFIA